jgi:16S rRNA (uracil1498-N3)-methyltransferase
MHRCHIHHDRLLSDAVALDRDESRHLKTVLRLREGDPLELFDGSGLTRAAVVGSLAHNSMTLRPTAPARSHPPPRCALSLFACISKGRRMDWTVEKAVELSVARIVPVLSARTIVRLDAAERRDKAERWRRVALDAARQSACAWLPEIAVPVDFPAALALCQGCPPVFTAALDASAVPLRDALADFAAPPAAAGWFTGPEGDFTPEELECLKRAGSRLVSLGPTTLRAETAAIYGLCALGCAWL